MNIAWGIFLCRSNFCHRKGLSFFIDFICMIYEVSYFFGVFNSDYHPQLFLSIREMAKNIFLTTLNGKLNIPKKFFEHTFQLQLKGDSYFVEIVRNSYWCLHSQTCFESKINTKFYNLFYEGQNVPYLRIRQRSICIITTSLNWPPVCFLNQHQAIGNGITF